MAKDDDDITCGAFISQKEAIEAFLPFLIEDLKCDKLAFSLKGNINLGSWCLILRKELNHNQKKMIDH